MRIFFLSILAECYEKGTIRKQETAPKKKKKKITFKKTLKSKKSDKVKKIPIN